MNQNTETFMNEVISYLDADWVIQSEFKQELLEILEKDFNNDFERFLKDVIETEDFGTTKPFLNQLYYEDLYMDY